MGYLIYKLSTLKLWFIYERTFPVISISDQFKILSPVFHNILSGLSLFMLLAILILPKRKLVLLFLITESLLLFTDIMRWQPAVFQFFITFIAYLYSPKRFKTYLLILLSATYFYSGLHKFNLRFIKFSWSYDILVGFLDISPKIAYSKIARSLGMIIPLFEILCGLILLSRWKKWAFYGIILTHVLILIYLGPMGRNHNTAVWGWNLIMIAYAIYYLKNTAIERLNLKPEVFTLFWVILVYILPAFNLFEYYYPYFSFDLYSGNRYYLILNTKVKKEEPFRNYAYQTKDNTYHVRLSVLKWSLDDINTPLTHNKWVYGRFIEAFEDKYPKLDPCYDIKYYPYKTTEGFKGY